MTNPSGQSVEHEPPIWPRARPFEDFEVGQVYEHHWGRTINEGDNSLFSTATFAWLPLHLNATYARQDGHPGIVLNPMLVFCVVFGLSVEDLSENGGAFLGVDDLTFDAPAYPGVTVTARSTVVAIKDSASRPHQGIVSWHTEGYDDDGRVLMSFTRTNLIDRRVA